MGNTKSGRQHYKNIDFEKNLTVASGKDKLEEAAPLWRFSHFGMEVGEYKHCHLCHSRINTWVAIKNAGNGVVLLIGHDCYDKLISFLATKKLESLNLGVRKSYISEIKKYCKKHINESFLAWFGAEKCLSENLKATLDFIKKFGYAPSLETAQALVEHYKNNRLFSLEELLDPDSDMVEILELLQLADELLSERVTLTQHEKLNLDCLNNITGAEEDVFFQEALRKTAPASLISGDIVQWLENARDAKMAIVDEAWKRAMIDLQKQIAEKQDEYLLLSFRRGVNPKHGTSQWECWSGGKKYVLARECSYNEGEGAIFVGIDRALVPDRVFLVTKLTLVPDIAAPLYRWV